MRGVLLLVAMVGLADPVAAADWPAIVKGIEHRVPRVEILSAKDDSPAICSGVFVAPGVVLTAAHCVHSADGSRLDVTVDRREAAVARYSRILDLAVLRVEPKGSDVIVPLADKTPPVGTEVCAAGFSFGYRHLSVTFGRLALVLDDDGQQMRVDGTLVPGMSGGPLLDDQGRLVGIASGIYYIGPAHLSALVRIEDVRDYAGMYLPRPDKP